MIAKLNYYGIRNNTLNWLQSWLISRSQFVCVSGRKSPITRVTSGVVQGSVLGPTLFCLFINDISNVIRFARYVLFADDLKLYLPIPDRAAYLKLLSDIIAIFDWADVNDLVVAVLKCFLLHLGSKFNLNFTYSVRGMDILSPVTVRDLGIIVDRDLTFDSHIRHISHQASARLAVVRRSLNIRDTDFRLQMFKTFIRPLLEFATCVWSPHTNTHIKLLESVQRHFTKYLPNMPDVPYYDRCLALGIAPLYTRRLMFDLIMMYNIVHDFVHFPCNPFTLNPRSTRSHTFNICHISSTKDVRRDHFSVRAISVWNDLSSPVVSAPNVSSFRSRLLRDAAFLHAAARSAQLFD